MWSRVDFEPRPFPLAMGPLWAHSNHISHRLMFHHHTKVLSTQLTAARCPLSRSPSPQINPISSHLHPLTPTPHTQSTHPYPSNSQSSFSFQPQKRILQSTLTFLHFIYSYISTPSQFHILPILWDYRKVISIGNMGLANISCTLYSLFAFKGKAPF